MRRRWIIRSLLLGLLVICGCGWLFSHFYWTDLYHANTSSVPNSVWACGIGHGRLYVMTDHYYGAVGGWHFRCEPHDSIPTMIKLRLVSPSTMGFTFRRFGGTPETPPVDYFLAIPFWSATTISAFLLWWAWRKPRPTALGPAFPVDAAAPFTKE
jgi:hypothetical protein